MPEHTSETERQSIENEQVRVGDYVISRWCGHVFITHRSGEGGSYPEDQLNAMLRKFVAEHF